MKDRPTFKLIEKLRQRRRRHRQRSRLYRGLVIAAGTVVTFAGLALLALPGPAFAVIPVGLYLLALEFDWAERLLHTALRYANNTKNNSFVKSVVRFVKHHPRLTAAILALFLTLVGVLVAGMFALNLVPNRS